MKSIKLYLSVMLMAVAGLFSCSDNFDAPPVNIPTATIEANTTIADFKAEYWQDKTPYCVPVQVAEGESKVIAGRVISSDASGNIYKSLVIQDETGALAISINANSLYNTYRIGQRVVIDLNGMYVGKYANLLQLGYPNEGSRGTEAGFMALELFQANAQLDGLPDVTKIDTLVTSIGKLPTAPAEICKMQSQLVRFNKVQFTEAGKPYSEETSSTSRTLKDSSGATIIVRNSNYATFRSELLPEGEGSVVGILSYYNNAWQILLRSTDDVFDFKPIEGTKELPYSVDSAIKLQDQEISGWVSGYIVGAVAPGVTGDVSKNEDIQWTADAEMDQTLVIAPDANTKDISKCLIVVLEQDSRLRKLGNLRDNKGVYGKAIKLTGVFAKTKGQAGIVCTGASGTFEIDGVKDEEQGGDTPAGDGSKEKPYSVAQVIELNNNGSTVWAEGYIVGYVNAPSAPYVAKEGTVYFSATGAVASNVLIADSKDEKTITKLVAVNLPSSTEYRTKINLLDNPDNLGKKVKINGNLVKYFGICGIKELKGYELDGASSGGDTPDPNPTETIFSSTFLGETGGFTIKNVTKPESLTNEIWQNTSNYGWKASAYINGTNYETESWLVSPAITLPADKNATLTFDHARKFGETSHLAVKVSTDNTNWTNITLSDWPVDWTYISSGNIDLSAYKGKSVYIAFVYTSTSTSAATWEIKNFVIK